MVHLIDKKDCQFDNIFCHKIIQYRNKFLIDNHFPKSSSITLFPKCHLPINFINNINDEIFEKIKNNLLQKIAERYNIKKEYFDRRYLLSKKSCQKKVYRFSQFKLGYFLSQNLSANLGTKNTRISKTNGNSLRNFKSVKKT